jgi:hypothetical protein
VIQNNIATAPWFARPPVGTIATFNFRVRHYPAGSSYIRLLHSTMLAEGDAINLLRQKAMARIFLQNFSLHFGYSLDAWLEFDIQPSASV